MKKITISATVTLTDLETMPSQLIAALEEFGAISVSYCDAFDIKSADGLTKTAWIYISSDESKPYRLVNSDSECEGVEISDFSMLHLRLKGVCVEFSAQYPNGDKYGSPAYASNEDAAAVIVSEHLFAVGDAMTVSTLDRDDDGSEEFWLKIALPADFQM